MEPATPNPPAPHLDPTAWGQVLDSLDVASIFVAIGTWIGTQWRSRLSVEDVWQETLWQAWRDRQQHEWRNVAAYRGWLLAIARNRVAAACRDASRQKRGGDQRIDQFTDLTAQESVSGYLPPQSTTPSRIAGHRERALLMERALTALEPPLRQVVQLRLFEELPTAEISSALSIPLSTAKERLVRGVRRYRELLAGLMHGDSIAGAEPSP